MKMKMKRKERIAYTCAPGGENNIGNEFKGELPEKGSGLKNEDLEEIKEKLERDYEVELLDLNKLSKEEGIEELEGEERGSVLIVRRWIREEETDKIYEESNMDEWDKKYLDPNQYRIEIEEGKEVRKRGKVKNKLARSNILYIKGEEQEPEYLKGKGRIVDLEKREGILKEVERLKELNEKIKINVVEGNRYYDLKKTGIGYHGDTERAMVVCITIGGGEEGFKLCWQWFKDGYPKGENIEVSLNDGDMYIMSEKAVGMEWKLRKKYTLRHAGGAEKYRSLRRWEKRLEEKEKKEREKRKDLEQK